MASMLAGRVSHLSKVTPIFDRSRIEKVEMKEGEETGVGSRLDRSFCSMRDKIDGSNFRLCCCAAVPRAGLTPRKGKFCRLVC